MGEEPKVEIAARRGGPLVPAGVVLPKLRELHETRPDLRGVLERTERSEAVVRDLEEVMAELPDDPAVLIAMHQDATSSEEVEAASFYKLAEISTSEVSQYFIRGYEAASGHSYFDGRAACEFLEGLMKQNTPESTAFLISLLEGESIGDMRGDENTDLRRDIVKCLVERDREAVMPVLAKIMEQDITEMKSEEDEHDDDWEGWECRPSYYLGQLQRVIGEVLEA